MTRLRTKLWVSFAALVVVFAAWQTFASTGRKKVDKSPYQTSFSGKPERVVQWKNYPVPILPGWRATKGDELELRSKETAFAELIYRIHPGVHNNLDSEEAQLLFAAKLFEVDRKRILTRRTEGGYLRAVRSEIVWRSGHRMEVGSGLIFVGLQVIEFRYGGLYESNKDAQAILEMWQMTYWFASPGVRFTPQVGPGRGSPTASLPFDPSFSFEVRSHSATNRGV